MMMYKWVTTNAYKREVFGNSPSGLSLNRRAVDLSSSSAPQNSILQGGLGEIMENGGPYG